MPPELASHAAYASTGASEELYGNHTALVGEEVGVGDPVGAGDVVGESVGAPVVGAPVVGAPVGAGDVVGEAVGALVGDVGDEVAVGAGVGSAKYVLAFQEDQVFFLYLAS